MLGIVVVGYGSADLLRRHLAPRAPAGVPVVVVDNWRSARDRAATEQVCAEYGWHLVPRPDNPGFGAGVDIGVDHAAELGCTTVVTLNPDLSAEPDVVRALGDAVEQDPTLLVSARVLRADGTPWFTGGALDLRTGRTRRVEAQGPSAAGWVSGACLAFDIETFRRVGGYGPDYVLYWEDVDLSHRWTAAGGRLLVRHDLVVHHDVGGTQGGDGRAKSAVYYRYNTRNRLLFGARHLPRRALVRWVVTQPAYARSVLLRGGRRQLLTSARPLIAVVRGSLEGAALALRRLVLGRAPQHADGTLRVGVDAHVLDGKHQGSRTWVRELLARLPEEMPEATLVVYTSTPQGREQVPDHPRVEHRQLPEMGPVRRNLRFWPAAVRRDRLDLLVTQYFAPPIRRAAQVVVVHDVLFETHPELFDARTRWRNRVLVRLAVRFAGTVVTVSEYSRGSIAAVYGRRAGVSVVHNGVTVARSSDAGSAPSAGVLTELPAEPFALMVGRLEPRKNLALALDALEFLPPQARLVVVGRDDAEDPGTLARLTADPRVLHLVDVPGAALDEIYRRAAVLLMPSLGEGWGIPVLEALAAGTPVVAADGTALPEAGGDHCTYLDVTAPGAARALADVVARALDGRLPLDEAAAAEHVRRFSWEASAAELAASLRRAAVRARRA